MLTKFDINSSYICPPHLYTAANLPGESQKVIFQQYYSYTSDYLRYLRKNKLLLRCPIHRKNVAPLPCKIAQIFYLFHFPRVSTIEYQVAIRMSCGSVLLWRGLNFSRAWWTILLIIGKKDWKHVPVQKLVILNICCNAAYLALCTNVRRIAFEKVCKLWMTLKVIQGHHRCCHLIGHIRFPNSLPL